MRLERQVVLRLVFGSIHTGGSVHLLLLRQDGFHVAEDSERLTLLLRHLFIQLTGDVTTHKVAVAILRVVLRICGEVEIASFLAEKQRRVVLDGDADTCFCGSLACKLPQKGILQFLKVDFNTVI